MSESDLPCGPAAVTAGPERGAGEVLRATEEAVYQALGPVVDVERSLAALRRRLAAEPAAPAPPDPPASSDPAVRSDPPASSDAPVPSAPPVRSGLPVPSDPYGLSGLPVPSDLLMPSGLPGLPGLLGLPAPAPAPARDRDPVASGLVRVLGGIPAPVALVAGADHRVLYLNPAYRAAFGDADPVAPAAAPLPEPVHAGGPPSPGEAPRAPRRRTTFRREAVDGRSFDVSCVGVADGTLLFFATDVTGAARAHGRAREDALSLRRALLPRTTVQPDGLLVATADRTGDLAHASQGDWYAVLPQGAGRAALVIGHAGGRGPGPVARMARLRTAVHAYSRLGLPPDDVLRHLHALVEDEPDRYATCAYVVHDPAAGTLTYSSAGHLPPLLRTPDGAVRRLDDALGPPLGAAPCDHAPATAPFPPGSTLVLCTPGAVNGWARDPYAGVDALGAALRAAAGSPQETAEALADRVRAPVDPGAVLVARRTGRAPAGGDAP
ncbi:PP2C family protein-serine/threonine phosphatase [Streptomyces sp. NPDC001941]|uniref:PP2C family protein-serine/threonine phosphatase n=1 Tax=Streptomyces sp. NPDC001941 TaxID=3154659 RepID=UPI0033177AC0